MPFSGEEQEGGEGHRGGHAGDQEGGSSESLLGDGERSKADCRLSRAEEERWNGNNRSEKGDKHPDSAQKRSQIYPRGHGEKKGNAIYGTDDPDVVTEEGKQQEG